MFKKSLVPAWVRNLSSDDINKELLSQISIASDGNLSAPREMYFIIMDIQEMEDAEKLCNDIVQGRPSWVTAINQSENGLFEVESAANEYSISQGALLEDETYIANLAHRYNAIYDGWYASA